MTHRREFTEAVKRQALERAGHRCQDPLCGISDEWVELWQKFVECRVFAVAPGAEGDLPVPTRSNMTREFLTVLRAELLYRRKLFPKALNPIIKRFQLDASPLLEIDHEREDADGGEPTLANAVVRCVFCHQFKTQDRARARRAAPKKQMPEQLDVLKTAKVEVLRQMIDKTGVLGATRALSGARQTDNPGALVRMKAASSPALPKERRHYSDAQVTEAAQRRERAIYENDGFFGA